MADMTEDERNAAAAFIKLQDDVEVMILGVVIAELTKAPYGPFAAAIAAAMTMQIDNRIHEKMQRMRVGYAGQQLPY